MAKNTETYAMYRNKKNGKIAKLVEEDKKYKTCLLEFEDGEEQQISTSTLKRWWELVDEDEDYEEDDEDLEQDDEDAEEYEDDDEDSDEEDEEDSDDEDDDDSEEEEDEDDDDSEDDEEDEEELDDEEEDEEDDDSDEDSEEDDEESEDDDEDVEEDDEDEEEEAPKKKSSKSKQEKAAPAKKDKKPRSKSVENDDVKALVEYVEDCVREQDGEIFQPQSQPRNRAFKVGGHMYARLLYSVKAVTVACREEAVSKTGIEPTKSINHMFSELYTFEKLDKTAKANIKKLLQASFDYQMKKNQGSDKPKKEKAAPAKEKKAAKTTGKKTSKKEK